MIAAYTFIGSVILFWGSMFGVKKDRDGQGAYIVIFLACLVMTLAGLALALDALGFNPKVSI